MGKKSSDAKLVAVPPALPSHISFQTINWEQNIAGKEQTITKLKEVVIKTRHYTVAEELFWRLCIVREYKKVNLVGTDELGRGWNLVETKELISKKFVWQSYV